jgi:hypothetical protein
VAVPDLELTRDPGDRRLYVLDGVGSLRLEGWSKRRATLDAAGRSWQAGPAGFWKRRVEATDAAGSPVAQFEPRSMRRGGVLRVGERELRIEPASNCSTPPRGALRGVAKDALCAPRRACPRNRRRPDHR